MDVARQRDQSLYSDAGYEENNLRVNEWTSIRIFNKKYGYIRTHIQ